MQPNVVNKENTKQQIKELIEKYNKVVEEQRASKYKEEETKKDFILPLFEALGWNVYNKTNRNDSVSAEETISKKRVDYGFRISGIPKFFLEAKPLDESLDGYRIVEEKKVSYIEQAIEYAYNRGCTWAVLTNFKDLKVFNAELKTAFPNEFFSLNYKQFLEDFDQLWCLSRESFEQGLLDKQAEKWGKKIKRIPVDKQLLMDFTNFRELLSKNIMKLNQSKNLTEEQLDEAVQRILDRLIFIRNCEDRELEPKRLISNLRDWESKGRGLLIKYLRESFEYFDQLYNSKLFQKHLCDSLEIDSEVLSDIINGLYKTKGGIVSYDFSAIEADVLGNIYEQYLGHVLKKTEKRAKVTENHVHRKEQGIYYTPTYIVNYIVRNTLGELLKDKKVDAEKIKVLDPACGSGSFLIKAFDVLNEYYSKKGDYEQTKFDTSGGGMGITFTKKVEILKNNIFGVDLDFKAVEIAQLNLLLKIAEKSQRLPLLQENIKCGNSLIDEQTVAGNKAFKWEEQFKEITQEGGFDVVIGNPPYGKEQMEFIHKCGYAEADDIYTAFLLKCSKLLKEGGYMGFIIPVSWQTGERYQKFREKIFNGLKLLRVINLPFDTFIDAYVDTGIALFRKIGKSKELSIYSYPKNEPANKLIDIDERLESIDYQLIIKDKYKRIFPNPSIYKLIHKFSDDKKFVTLGELTKSAIGILISSYKVNDNLFERSLPLFVGNVYRYNTQKENIKYVDFSKHLGTSYVNYYNGERLLVRRIVNRQNRLMTNLETEDFVTKKDLYSFKLINPKYDPRYLLALLNSKLFSYLYISTSTIATKDDFRQTTLAELRRLPVLKLENDEQKMVINFVDKMLSLNKRLNEIGDKKTDESARIEEEIKKTDTEIDERVYEIYGITEEERKIIAESLK